MGLFRACVRQLPKLQAEEALLAAEATALGTGSMSSSDLKAAHGRLLSAAGLGRLAKVKATPDLLAGMGIPVQIVEVKEKLSPELLASFGIRVRPPDGD